MYITGQVLKQGATTGCLHYLSNNQHLIKGVLRHYSNLSTLDAASDMTKRVVRGMNGKSNYHYSRH